MTRNINMADPEMTLEKAAKLMAQDDDIGLLPVSENDRLAGYEDESIDTAAERMANLQAHRMPVIAAISGWSG
jgi:CBS domain-containing protein